jgi:hypothetical protein
VARYTSPDDSHAYVRHNRRTVGSSVFCSPFWGCITRTIGTVWVSPCGGGFEYLHRSPVSRRRRRKGHPVPGGITGLIYCRERERESVGTSVGVVIRLRAELPKNRCSIPVRVKRFLSPPQCTVQLWGPPALDSVSIGVKVAGTWSWLLIYIQSQGEKFVCTSTPPWHGA